MLDLVHVDLFRLIVNGVQNAPLPNPHAIATWNTLELAHARGPRVLLELAYE
jgi:hypothetical protein